LKSLNVPNVTACSHDRGMGMIEDIRRQVEHMCLPQVCFLHNTIIIRFICGIISTVFFLSIKLNYFVSYYSLLWFEFAKLYLSSHSKGTQASSLKCYCKRGESYWDIQYTRYVIPWLPRVVECVFSHYFYEFLCCFQFWGYFFSHLVIFLIL
jgi:hypothetical protein